MPTVTRTALTVRELEVLDAYEMTGSYKAAAEALGLGEDRIGDALENVRTKTGALNTAQAMYRSAAQLRAFRTNRRKHGSRSRRHPENRV